MPWLCYPTFERNYNLLRLITNSIRIYPFVSTHPSSSPFMIQAETFNFLRDLKENNHKEWFDANRPRYEAAKANFIQLVDFLIDGIHRFDPGVFGLEPKQCLFRINRDIRFSKNKAPYKHNLSAHIAAGGRKSPFAGYYIHLEPEQCFLGGGKYRPPSQELKAIRHHIDLNAPELRAILADKTFQETFGELQGDSLKTAPKGYPKDHPDIDLIKRKDFFVSYTFGEAEVLAEDFPEKVVDLFEVMHPMNRFFNEALKEVEGA